MAWRDRQIEVLRAGNRLGPDCTATAIHGRLSEAAPAGVALVSVRISLALLRRKGLVTRRTDADGTKLYSLTASGAERLSETMREAFDRHDRHGGGGIRVLARAPTSREG